MQAIVHSCAHVQAADCKRHAEEWEAYAKDRCKDLAELVEEAAALLPCQSPCMRSFWAKRLAPLRSAWRNMALRLSHGEVGRPGVVGQLYDQGWNVFIKLALHR